MERAPYKDHLFFRSRSERKDASPSRKKAARAGRVGAFEVRQLDYLFFFLISYPLLLSSLSCPITCADCALSERRMQQLNCFLELRVMINILFLFFSAWTISFFHF